MTKLLAALLCLVMSALLTVGQCTESEGEIIVKEDHRVVVVEYDALGKTNSRVLISPPERGHENRGDESAVFSNVKNKRELHASPEELICDAIGKCKHKVASVLGRVYDPTAHDMKENLAHEPQYAEQKAHETKRTMSETATKKANKTQNVLEKAKSGVRRLGTAVNEALKLTKIGSMVSLIGISAAYGMCVWVTVVSKYLLASLLGRHRFGVVQSKVYSVYFKAISVGILVGLLGHVISQGRKILTDAVEMWQAVNLLSSILMVELNASFVEPRAIKAMLERIKVEKEEGRGLNTLESHSSEAAVRTCVKKVREKMDEDAVNRRLKKLNERLRRLNAYSSRLNLLTLVSLTWHFVYLGHRLSLTY
ncbi:hypothetical protein N665_0089s0051 [Sinapis alba]|nr:hypothetical protein N665_0089s0051 [Sinapis alba]